MRHRATASDALAQPDCRLEPTQYLTFWLGKELFALGIMTIKEIIQYGQITTVPLMPAHIRGVINLRGSVVPVIDLTARIGRGSAKPGRRTCIVILEMLHEGDRFDIGVMVDSVSAVIDIRDEDIEPAPVFGASVRTDFISGLGKLNGQFIVILDIENTFSVDELARLRPE